MNMVVSSVAPIDASWDSSVAPSAAAASSGFAQIIDRGLAELNASSVAAEGALKDLAAGKPVELHETMIKLEAARISVLTFVQVRNKLVESYQDLMRMQM